MILCPEGDLSDNDIWQAFMSKDASTVMTVSRRGAQRVNNIVVVHLFQDQSPLTRIPGASVAKGTLIYPLKDMTVLFTENRDKAARIVNGQEATIISAQNNTIILRLTERQRVFVYPVTHIVNDRPVTYYPFTDPYAQTITKSPGQNITHLIVWLDSDLVPAGTAYVGYPEYVNGITSLFYKLYTHTRSLQSAFRPLSSQSSILMAALEIAIFFSFLFFFCS